MSVPQKVSTLTPETFDFGKMNLGHANKFDDYGFTKYRVGYKRDDTTDDTCMIKITNLTVTGVYEPRADKDGNPPKNPKYSVIFVTNEPSHATFFDKLNQTIKSIALTNKTTMFSSGADLTAEDIDLFYKPFGTATTDASGKAQWRFSVSFPFNNPSIKEAVDIHYYDTTVDTAIVQSTNLLEKLGQGSVVDLFLKVTNIKVDSTNEFDCQRTVSKRINVQKFNAKGAKSDGFSRGLAPESVNVANIVMGDVVTNVKFGGRSLKPTYNNGSKTQALRITLENVRCSFKRQVKVNEDTGKSETSFDVVYTLTPEHRAKFEEIDAYLKKDLLDNYSTKYEPGKRINAKLMDGKFRGAVKDGKDKDGNQKYDPNMWFNVYVKDEPDGSFDFCGNFYKPDGTKYSNAEVDADIFGKTHTCTMTVYLKHIWFGKYYSTKFNMACAMINLSGVEYDYGDAYVDKPAGTPGFGYNPSADLGTASPGMSDDEN